MRHRRSNSNAEPGRGADPFFFVDPRRMRPPQQQTAPLSLPEQSLCKA
jgi:hypothetical protein